MTKSNRFPISKKSLLYRDQKSRASVRIVFRTDAFSRPLASFFLYSRSSPIISLFLFRFLTLRLSSHFLSPLLFSLRFFIVYPCYPIFIPLSLALDILIARLPRYFRESQIYGPAPQWIALTTYSYTYTGMYDRVSARTQREKERQGQRNEN